MPRRLQYKQEYLPRRYLLKEMAWMQRSIQAKPNLTRLRAGALGFTLTVWNHPLPVLPRVKPAVLEPLQKGLLQIDANQYTNSGTRHGRE